MTQYCLVHGTGDRDPGWTQGGSPLRQHLLTLGWSAYAHPSGLPFRWSGEVGYLLWLVNRLDWDAGADALCYYLQGLSLPIISHSHGAQLVVRAAARGLTVPVWIDISGPIRGDSLTVYDQARPNLGRHLYVHDESRWGDWTRLAGQLFDGRFGLPVKHPKADADLPLKGVGHSGVLNDPECFSYWAERILPAAVA